MLGLKESTIESPFEFYNQLLYYDGIKIVHNNFYQDNQFTKGYRFIQEENSEFSFIAWINNEDITDIVDSDRFFKKVINSNTFFSLQLLNEKTEKLQDDERKIFIIKQLNELNSFLLKLKSIKTDYNQECTVINEELINVIKNIFFKYNSLQIGHKLFDTIVNPRNTANSFFHCKDYPMSFYKKLYDITKNLLLIDDTETSEDDFINVFTSSNPFALNSKIQFTKNNNLVSYFLRKIQPFFENLNFTSVEISKCFYNKQNKLLTATDLSTALSRGQKKQLFEKDNIDESLSFVESF